MEVREPPSTYSEYCRLPEDAPRYEIIEGVGLLTPSPERNHQRVSARLGFLIYQYVEIHGLGEIYYAPFDVILSETSVVQPDLLVVVSDRLEIVAQRGVFGPPDLVVEIASPSTTRRDLDQKLALYTRCGVREYWLADPGRRTVDTWVSAASPLDTHRLIAGDGSITESTVLPGLVIPLTEVFAGLSPD